MHEQIVAAFDAAAIPVLIINAQGRVEFANRMATDIFGYKKSELADIAICKLMPTAQGRNLNDWLATSGHSAIEGRHKSGLPLYISFRATQTFDTHGTTLHTLVLQGYSQQTRESEKLDKTFLRIDTALRGAEIGLFEIDLVTGKSIVSPTWNKVMGYHEDAAIDAQAAWLSRIHPDDLPIVRVADKNCIAGRSKRSLADYRMRSSDDASWIWMRSDAVVAQRDSEGRALRLVGVQTDITEMKQKETELALSETRFRTALDNAPIGMALVGLDGSWLIVNDAVCNFLGYSKKELLKTDFQTLTHADDLKVNLDFIADLLAGVYTSYKMEKRYIHSDGTIIWGDLNVVLMRDHKGDPAYFISQIVDITEQRALALMKSEFVATVSHELRTPLTSLLGSLDLVASTTLETLPEQTNRLIVMARKSGERLRILIDDILDMERLSGKSFKVTYSDQCITDLLNQSVTVNQPYADQFNVRLNLKAVEQGLHGVTDPKLLQQILANLLSNAAKFSYPGDDVDVILMRQGEMFEIKVADHGKGIPSHFTKSIFDPFTQVERSNTRIRGGSGMGLNISKKIVEQMGGTIGFESEEGKGSTFWFRLPL